MRKEEGEAWLVEINGYQREGWEPLREYRFGLAYNYGASAVIPQYDAELERLIRERAAAEYTGTVEDNDRITTIFDRVDELGGKALIWR